VNRSDSTAASAALGAFLLMLSLAVFLLLAQDATSIQATSTPEAAVTEAVIATAEAAACSVDALRTAKSEIDALLATFEDDAATDANAALASLYSAGEAYRQLALDCGYLPENFDLLVINSTDVPAVLTAMLSLNTDPLRGQLLYNGAEPSTSGDTLGCAGCHNAGEVAPPTEGTWTRWDEQRRLEPRFADYTFEQYIVESILLPWEYFVPTYPEYTMPDFYHEQLSYQDLADIVAYLSSQDQLTEDE